MSDHRDAWTDRLSEYVDGDLDAAERAALGVHLQVCADCARTVAELRAVVERAASLEASPPAADLWPGIAARIGAPDSRTARLPRARVLDLSAGRVPAWPWRGLAAAPRPRRRWSFTLPQLAAAAAVIVMLSSVTVWVVLSRRPAAPALPATVALRAPGALPEGGADATAPAAFEAAHYDAAIAELEQALARHRDELDPATVQVIERNLRIIDDATAQARRALAADPASPYLNNHLATQLKRKITLLRQATAVVAAHSS